MTFTYDAAGALFEGVKWVRGCVRAAWDKAAGNDTLRQHGLSEYADSNRPIITGAGLGYVAGAIGFFAIGGPGEPLLAPVALLLGSTLAGPVGAHRFYASYKVGEARRFREAEAKGRIAAERNPASKLRFT